MSEPSPSIPLPGTRPPPETMSHLIMRWATRAIVVGVAASCLGHLVFLAIASAVSLAGPAQAGNSATGSQGVQMAVMSAEQFGALEEAALDTAMPAIADGPPTALPGIDLRDTPGGGGLPD
ncbi:MAG: hypothetical protein ACT4PL_03070, partial [Phycisphaerales bacterium]